jgi:hypothetical protein
MSSSGINAREQILQDIISQRITGKPESEEKRIISMNYLFSKRMKWLSTLALPVTTFFVFTKRKSGRSVYTLSLIANVIIYIVANFQYIDEKQKLKKLLNLKQNEKIDQAAKFYAYQIYESPNLAEVKH